MAIRVCLIGCGAISAGHRNALASVSDVELTAFCDINPQAAQDAARCHNARAYTDWRAMLTEESPDACWICVPPYAHEGMEEACLEKGIPFFVEKPVRLDLDSAVNLARRVAQKGLVTAAGYVIRSSDAGRAVRQALAGADVASVRAVYDSRLPGSGKTWHGIRRLSGGQVTEQATHLVDLMRWIVGEVREVFCYPYSGVNAKQFPSYDVEDASATCLLFEHNAVGTLSCSWLWNGWRMTAQFFAPELSVTYEWGRCTVDTGGEQTVHSFSDNPTIAQDSAFIEAVRTGDPSLVACTYQDAVRTLSVTTAIAESAASDTPVRVTYV